MADDVKTTEPVPPTEPTEFEKQSLEATPSLVAEFLDFLVHNKAWWIVPIIVVLLLMGVLVFLGESVVAPFIYPLF